MNQRRFEQRALKSLNVKRWGLRRQKTVTRQDMTVVEVDDRDLGPAFSVVAKIHDVLSAKVHPKRVVGIDLDNVVRNPMRLTSWVKLEVEWEAQVVYTRFRPPHRRPRNWLRRCAA